MGYNTDFYGEFTLDPPLSAEQQNIINDYSFERHENHIEYPGYYAQWETNGTNLFSENEKHYDYAEWLAILIDKFFNPWGIQVSGEVRWQGEDSKDCGILVVEDNKIYKSEFIMTPGPREEITWNYGR